MTDLQHWPVTTWFAGLMGNKLNQNNHKPGWENDSALVLLARLKQELEELENSITMHHLNATTLNASHAIQEAIDVANFAMFIADNYANERY